jgi:5-methylcytosine-specific restriction endonuclease McrA
MYRLYQFAKSFFCTKVEKKTKIIIPSPYISPSKSVNRNSVNRNSVNKNSENKNSENKNSENKNSECKKGKRKPIPSALREQVWLKHFGRTFEHKCSIVWCTNIISVFNWECGHNIPHSKNGEMVLNNLVPLCSRCNKSMNDHYTIDEFNLLGDKWNQ